MAVSGPAALNALSDTAIQSPPLFHPPPFFGVPDAAGRGEKGRRKWLQSPARRGSRAVPKPRFAADLFFQTARQGGVGIARGRPSRKRRGGDKGRPFQLHRAAKARLPQPRSSSKKRTQNTASSPVRTSSVPTAPSGWQSR